MNPNDPTSNSPDLSRYPLVQVTKKSDPGSIFYQFTTDYSIEYELVFRPDKDYLIEFPDISDLAYSFIFDKVGANSALSKRGGIHDPKVRNTIVFALSSAFLTTPDLIISYQCRTKDRKQAARNKLFLDWYMHYGGDFAVTEYTNEPDVFAAAFFRRDHPHIALIDHVFNKTFTGK